MAAQNHAQKRLRASLLMLGGCGVAGLVAGTVLRNQASMPDGLAFILLLVAGALAFLAMVPWWKRLDHMQKDAQYESWYWGGIIGATVALAGIAVFAGVQSDVTKGAFVLFIAQCAAVTIYWIYWRIRYGGGGL